MRGWRAWSLAGAVAAAATTAVYVGVIVSEGDNSVWDVLPWVALMVLGVLAIFSIGIGFLVAALLAGVGAARAVHPAT